jgi:hypothetical protein
MSDVIVSAGLGVLVLIIVTEVVAAVLPLVLVIVLVPHEQRRELAELLATVDSSRRLRLWTALRLAVMARRRVVSGTRLGGPR